MKSGFPLDFASLSERYAAGALTPTALADEIWRRCESHPDPAVWIHRLPRAELLAHARRVEAAGRARQPLYGLFFAIKDNIDLAGAPTTAACPAFAYTPARSAPVVERLMAAGAIPVGKTNLDQFATGLVGVRSPHGAPRNPFHSDYISGGSSSGSAVAVAAGLVSFSLGTDTAGSGRVPASFNNLVGLKPTRGWLATEGVVPACRSLDCVSVFALTVEDAQAAARVAGGAGPGDALGLDAPPARFRFGVPAESDLEWFGDALSGDLFEDALARLESLGGARLEIDFGPFREAARLLYDGPWIAERWAALKDFHAAHADAFFPVTRQIVEQGAKYTAADLFAGQYRLEELKRQADAVWKTIDCLALPTAATIFRRTQVEADPVRLNSRLGHYTNFANLLDCAALAVPAGFRPDKLPFGITLFGPAGSDARLAALGAAFHRADDAVLGATGHPLLPARLAAAGVADPGPGSTSPAATSFEIAVVGAHLSGMPLNRELTDRGGRLLRAARTAGCYRLHALAGTTPPKPGLVRVAPGEGAPIEIEVWSLPATAWAGFVAAIPPPLGIGTLLLEDGSSVKGFLCEPAALAGAKDITSFGGWRAYRAAL